MTPSSRLIAALTTVSITYGTTMPVMVLEPTLPPLDDWIVTTDDRPIDVFGCDQIGIRDRNNLSKGIISSSYSMSPQRLAAAPDGSLLVATGAAAGDNSTHIFYGDPKDAKSWSSYVFLADIAPASAPGITLDSQIALFFDDQRKELGSYRVADLVAPRISSIYSRTDLLGVAPDRTAGKPEVRSLPKPVGSIPDLWPITIEMAPDGRSAHIVARDGYVYTIDVRSMQESRPKVAIPLPSRLAEYNTFSSLSPDGRYLAIGTGAWNRIGMIDLETRVYTELELPRFGGQSRIWGAHAAEASL